jgi:hypothetical protein
MEVSGLTPDELRSTHLNFAWYACHLASVVPCGAAVPVTTPVSADVRRFTLVRA